MTPLASSSSNLCALRCARRFTLSATVAALVVMATTPPAVSQSFSLEDVLSPGYPSSLVSARGADHIAWIEFERGMRNVYAALGPAFEPRKLTAWSEDDGHDLTTLQISDDGSTVVFLRGHAPNRAG